MSAPPFSMPLSPRQASFLHLEPAKLCVGCPSPSWSVSVLRASLQPDRVPWAALRVYSGLFLCFALSTLQGQRPSPKGGVGVSLPPDTWSAEGVQGTPGCSGTSTWKSRQRGALLLAAGVEGGGTSGSPREDPHLLSPCGPVPALLALALL